jgi:uncharacterized protein (DUF1697 family)
MLNNYVVLLRAVNVSGKNIIKMKMLTDVLVQHEFFKVKTFIQSGNILISTHIFSTQEVQTKIQHIILEHFQIDVQVCVCGFDSFMHSVAFNPFVGKENKNAYITFFTKEIDQNCLNEFMKIDMGNEECFYHHPCLYFYLPNGMSNSKLTNAFIEKQLKVNGTTRNRNTLEKLVNLIEEF